jgi:hypothetical protein
VQGATENILSADTVGFPRQTECHSLGDDLIQRVSQSVLRHRVTKASFYCALFCVVMAHVRYNLEQVFIYDCYQ